MASKLMLNGLLTLLAISPIGGPKADFYYDLSQVYRVDNPEEH